MIKKDVLQSKKELVLIKNFTETTYKKFSEKSLINLEKDTTTAYDELNNPDKNWVNKEYAEWLTAYLDVSNCHSCRGDCGCKCS